MNRNSYEDYSVPSLSIASSRTRRNIPTKDINRPPSRDHDYTSKFDSSRVSERQSRPPIFNSKKSLQIQSRPPQPARQNGHSISRNVYLNREQNIVINHDIPTFRQSNGLSRVSSFERLQGNPESAKQIVSDVRNKIEQRKVDAKNSLFERKIQKLFQQAQFYEKQLLDVYEENNALAESLKGLQEMRRDALTLNYDRNIINI